MKKTIIWVKYCGETSKNKNDKIIRIVNNYKKKKSFRKKKYIYILYISKTIICLCDVSGIRKAAG